MPSIFVSGIANCDFLLIFVPLSSNGLSCGVMVTQQILVLSFQVRVLAAQQYRIEYQCGILFVVLGVVSFAGIVGFRLLLGCSLEEWVVTQHFSIFRCRNFDVF